MGLLSRRTFTVATAAALTGPVATGDSVARPVIVATPGPPGRRSAPAELRGMWLTTVLNRDWPSRAGLSRTGSAPNSSATSTPRSAAVSTP